MGIFDPPFKKKNLTKKPLPPQSAPPPAAPHRHASPPPPAPPHRHASPPPPLPPHRHDAHRHAPPPPPPPRHHAQAPGHRHAAPLPPPLPPRHHDPHIHDPYIHPRPRRFFGRPYRTVGAGLGILVAIVVLVVIAIFFAQGGNSGTETTKYYIGETVTTSSYQLTVNSVEDAQEIDTFTTDSNFVIVTFSIKNVGPTALNVSPDYLKLNKDLNTWNIDTEATQSLEDGLFEAEQVGAGVTKTFKAVFETPETSEDQTYTLWYLVCQIILTEKPA